MHGACLVQEKGLRFNHWPGANCKKDYGHSQHCGMLFGLGAWNNLGHNAGSLVVHSKHFALFLMLLLLLLLPVLYAAVPQVPLPNHHQLHQHRPLSRKYFAIPGFPFLIAKSQWLIASGKANLWEGFAWASVISSLSAVGLSTATRALQQIAATSTYQNSAAASARGATSNRLVADQCCLQCVQCNTNAQVGLHGRRRRHGRAAPAATPAAVVHALLMWTAIIAVLFVYGLFCCKQCV